jgi:hypothetical protein
MAIYANPRYAKAYYYRGKIKKILGDFNGASLDENMSEELGFSPPIGSINTIHVIDVEDILRG